MDCRNLQRPVALKHNISEAWSNIDVLLKQRYDELPKLVEACKQYEETLSRVIEARNLASQARATGNVAAVGTAEVALKGAVTQHILPRSQSQH